MTSAFDRQEAFDRRLDEIRREGAAAYARGEDRSANPYRGHPEPHFENAWFGGMAEAALGLVDEDVPVATFGP